VTRLQLVLALAAIEAAGAAAGDRIEHGSVIPGDLIPQLVRLGLTVVTQPGFVAERGDEYLTDVDAEDLPHLYRVRSLLDAGVSVALSTDAPYTNPNPWRAIGAAVYRRTPDGAVLGPDERVDAATALGLFTSDEPIEVGSRADLCLLETPTADVLADPAAAPVRATLVNGVIVHPAI
jgi:predicted amidohydrolase YtcJ